MDQVVYPAAAAANGSSSDGGNRPKNGRGRLSGRLLDAAEVAELLNVPVSWVRESTRSGAMPCVSLGEMSAPVRNGATPV